MKLNFGDRILLLRKKKNLSQKQLADQLGIVPTELASWENDTAFPQYKQLLKLADILDISLDFLTCRIEEQPDMEWIQMSS